MSNAKKIIEAGVANEPSLEKMVADIEKEGSDDSISDELYDWIQVWSMRHGSAVDAWGSERPGLTKQIYRMSQQGVRFKVIDGTDDNSEHFGVGALVDAQKKARKYIKAGWVVLAEEDNMSSAEVILYRPR